MSDRVIGKLERVELREVWEHEARSFTQWLENNIDVLNEALDLTLVNVDREPKPPVLSASISLLRTKVAARSSSRTNLRRATTIISGS